MILSLKKEKKLLIHFMIREYILMIQLDVKVTK